ncbi:MAG: twin-arginine translocase subunit TatC, partial [Acinetobacter sp.]|nr:twin-arginine translocase subunit TatC [Acinetobacter sp.]
PPDVFSMLALAVPMWLLFELGLWITKLTAIKKEHP